MTTPRSRLNLVLFTAALATTLALAPREAAATSTCASGGRAAVNIQLTVTGAPLCMDITAEGGECGGVGTIHIDNRCDDPVEVEGDSATACGCSTIATYGSDDFLLIVDTDPKVKTGKATFTARSGQAMITMDATYDILDLPVFPPQSGCAFTGAPPSAPLGLLAATGALALVARRRSRLVRR